MRMRTRKILIWLFLILLGVPLAAVLFDDISAVIDHIELLASLILILTLAVAGWRLKRTLKSHMQHGLGRGVEDHELASIRAWMQIPDAAKAANEVEKHDFGE